MEQKRTRRTKQQIAQDKKAAMQKPKRRYEVSAKEMEALKRGRHV